MKLEIYINIVLLFTFTCLFSSATSYVTQAEQNKSIIMQYFFSVRQTLTLNTFYIKIEM